MCASRIGADAVHGRLQRERRDDLKMAVINAANAGYAEAGIQQGEEFLVIIPHQTRIARNLHRPGHRGGPEHMLRNRYVWADEDDDLAWTVAVIQGLDVETVPAIYGGSTTTRLGELTFAEAMNNRNEHVDDHAVLQLLIHERYVVAIEPNGRTGSLPEIARRASRDGRSFFSVCWSPSAFQVVQARDGQLTASFDPNLIRMPAGATDLLPGWAGHNDFPLDRLKSSCLAAMEQQTGLAFDRSWLERQLPTYRIPDPDERLKDIKSAQAAATDAVLNDDQRHPGALPDIDELLDSGEHVHDTDRERGGSDPVIDGPHSDGPPEPGRRLFGS